MSTLEEIRKVVEACRTYNFGMRYADKLAHEDADKLIAALEAVEALALTWQKTPKRPSTFDAALHHASIKLQTEITEALR